MTKKTKTSLSKIQIHAKHFLLVWLFSVIGFVIVLALATKYFTSTVQETPFGNSDYFTFLSLGFFILGLLSFGFAILEVFFRIIRKKKTIKVIKSAPFLVATILLVVLGAIIKDPLSKQIESYRHTPTPIKQEKTQISPDEVFELTNEERVKNGLKPLKRNSKLDEVALERAKTILRYDEFTHEAELSGAPYTKIINDVNYWNTDYGENLAKGQDSSKNVVIAWMNSEGHKANILSTKYQEIGIAAYSGEFQGHNITVTVQIFGGYSSPNYTPELINGWSNSLNSLKNTRPSWENIRNYPATYEANKQDADRMIEIINTRIYRIEKIVNRMQSNKWLTTEENNWTYEDEALYKEQEAIATKLNSFVWK